MKEAIMHQVTPIYPRLTETQETKVSLPAPASVSVVESEGYRRVRCSAAMIGLAISMSAAGILLPNQSKPAMAINSSVALTNLSTTEQGSNSSPTPTKLTPPALKHEVKKGETLWKLSEEYQINPKALAASNNLPLQADLVAGQTLKIPSADLPQEVTKGQTKSAAQKPQSQEGLESSLSNLRETRKRLQESLVALRLEDSTLKSKTKVIVTEVADINQSTSETTSNPQSLNVALESESKGAIEIPVEMPTAEFDSQTSATPQIIENNQPISTTHNPTSTATTSEDWETQRVPQWFSSKELNERSSEPTALPSPDTSAFSRSAEENAPSLDISPIKTNNRDTSTSSSVNAPLEPAVINNGSQNFQQPAPEAIELQIEPPKTATVVPRVPIPQPQIIQQPSAEKVYRVQRGDTLNTIARKHGITVAQLIKANKITNPNLIKANQPLVIPRNRANQKPQSGVAVTTSVPFAPNNSIPSTLVSRVPSDRQFQGVSDIPEANGAIEIPVETVAETSTNKLRADIDNLQQQYNNNQPIPLKVEPPVSTVAQQSRNSEWEKDRGRELVRDRRGINTRRNTQSQISGQTEISGNEQIIGAASVNIEEYNNSLRIPVGETVAPELPGLSNPEQYLPDAPARFNGYIWPTKGVLTSGYGWRWGRMHKGVDIAAPVGTPIVAAAPGQVITAGWNSGGYGNLVKIRHADGSVTLYAHNSRILVRNGQQVEQGQLISEMGSTGYSTGPHLHFEVHPNGKQAVNPMALLPKTRNN